MITSLSPILDRILASAFVQSLTSIGLAFVLGLVIGLERQWRQRSAGLRTNVLVAVGAAAFADLGMRLLGAEGATRLVSYVVSGIGFLGAGVIVKDGLNIRGLNTAATLWCSAAIGAFAGSDLPGEAAALTVVVLAGNTLLRPIGNWVNRRPISSQATEADYLVHVTCDPESISDVRDLIDAELTLLHLPVRSVETLATGEDHVELVATLTIMTAETTELDEAVAALERSSLVHSATWSVETTS